MNFSILIFAWIILAIIGVVKKGKKENEQQQSQQKATLIQPNNNYNKTITQRSHEMKNAEKKEQRLEYIKNIANRVMEEQTGKKKSERRQEKPRPQQKERYVSKTMASESFSAKIVDETNGKTVEDQTSMTMSFNNSFDYLEHSFPDVLFSGLQYWDVPDHVPDYINSYIQ